MLRLLFSLLLVFESVALAGRVTLVVDRDLPAPARHGLAELETALRADGSAVDHVSRLTAATGEFLVVAGLCDGDGPAASLLRAVNAVVPEGPESVLIHRTTIGQQHAVVLCGSDARGLMYAALDVADRVGWNKTPGNPFAQVRNTREKPYIAERAVSIYTMQRACFESRLYDEAYWQRYFDLLAASRINSFVVIFGYENGGFMAPLYPYFFNVEQFPEVELVGITPEQQKRNVTAFTGMIRTAHQRGIDFTVAIWDHVYRGGVQGGGIEGASENAGKKVPGLVSGVTAENLSSYTKAALRKLLAVFPGLDGLQFRMHGESGLKRAEMAGFWHEVFGMIRQLRPGLRVDLRAKQLPDAIIEDGLNQGLKVRIATKYWMEQMGLPFHPTHVNRQNQQDRRHGYADLLRYPQRYQVHWRLWNGGTSRLLLWADPDYVRRFARSAKVYDGDSFEVNEMLATKMLGEPHDRKPLEILNPRYRYYDYEFQRYWHFYQVWGRVGYDPDTPPEVWEREFARRFGKQAGEHLMRGLHLASEVLPTIVAAAYRYRLFPTTRGWAEMTRMADLPQYAKDEEGSDIQQFLNVREEANSILEGTDTAARRPEQISRWFEHCSRQILDEVRLAGRAELDPGNKEYVSTVTDLRILAYLAKYHSQRLLGGLQYNLYQKTGDLFAFDDAIAREENAIRAWRQIVESAGDVYAPCQAFGVHGKGFPRHWKEELAKLEAGLEQLKAQRRQVRVEASGAAPRIAHVPLHRAGTHETLRIRASVGPAGQSWNVRTLYAKNNGEFRAVRMERVGDGRYAGNIPPFGAEGTASYVIEAANPAGERSVYPASGKANPIIVTITDDRQPPLARLERVSEAKPGEDVKVTASVTDPSGLRWVRLRYRHATQFEDYETLEMRRNSETGLYEATIPGDFIVSKWDLMYFLEAVDGAGNGRMYPDLEKEMPYVIIKPDR